MPNPNKIHPGLAEQLRARALTAGAQTFPVIVKYRAGASMSAAMTVPGLSAPRRQFRLIPASAFDATQDAINTLSDRDDVAMIWHDGIAHAILNASVPLINAPQLWQNNLTGMGIRVAVVDTGIDPNHPDLVNRVAAIADFTGEGEGDGHGHGTHVAGTIGGNGAASGGLYKGVAPECALYAAKVLNSQGSGSFSSVVAGIEWAVQQNVHVMNLSLGADGSCDGTDAMSEACDAAVAAGVIVCVAAGNAGPGAYTVGSPGWQNIKDWLMNAAKNLGYDPNTQGRGRADVFAAYKLGLISITSVNLEPASLGSNKLLNVSITVRNNSNTALVTQGPEPGFIYEEGDTFVSRGFADQKGAFRVALDFDGRTGLDHPYRWGLGAPLQPGETRTITGAIRLTSVGARNYWGALVEEQTVWVQDRVGVQLITVTPAISLLSATFAPATVEAGQLLSVFITIRNDGDAPVPTQGPDPNFAYEEGDTFYTRGFPDVAGSYRVAVDFDGRSGVDHPYRWGLGAPLQPGETRTITGTIRVKTTGAKSYWAGLVQEQKAWIQDRIGVTGITVTAPKPGPRITNVALAPALLSVGNYLTVSITVMNDSSSVLETQGPEPGFIYEEGDTFDARGFAAQSGKHRVGIDFDGRVGLDHPYRWGFGTPMQPGETRVISGAIHMRNAQTQNYWAGLVREYVAWIQDRQGAQLIDVKPGITITAITFSPTTVGAGQLLNVSITIRNDSAATLATQGPEPGFVYAEGDTFASRGFPAAAGNYRVGIDFDNRTGVDHPYRWGFGTPMQPGETRTITGAIRLQNAQTQNYWAGLVQEFIAWLQDRQGTQQITVQ
ncbi:MAG: S8 family serine peptidase [Chloroflexi bacterium]|nr:S8 family serine peptidase [Chloroflexota bacterium]